MWIAHDHRAGCPFTAGNVPVMVSQIDPSASFNIQGSLLCAGLEFLGSGFISLSKKPSFLSAGSAPHTSWL